MLVAVLMAGVQGEPKAEPEPQYPKSYGSPLSSYPEPSYGKKPPKSSYPAGYKQDYCDPRAPPACVQSLNDTFCLKDYEYPEKEIQVNIYKLIAFAILLTRLRSTQYAIEYDPLILKKYAEIADQSADNLVEGVSDREENQFDYSLYNGKTYDKGNWVGGEGYICPSDVLYARPVRAKNADGEWRVIVQNVAYYTQTQRVETCLFAGASCRTLAPCYQSKCVQKYVYHRMLSFDPCDTYKGLFIDIFKLPSVCSCHIPASKLH